MAGHSSADANHLISHEPAGAAQFGTLTLDEKAVERR